MLLKERRKWHEQSTKLKVHYKIYCSGTPIMIEIRITRQNRLEPTLILQSVNDVTNCKRETLFSVFINYTQLTLIQRRLNPGIKKIHGIRDQVLQQFWDQGSKFKAQMWDQSAKNIPCYDPGGWHI